MESSIPRIPNDLPAARKQYQKLLEYERKLYKLFAKLDQFLNEGKRGDVTEEYLADQRKRVDKTRRNMLAEKTALQEKFKEFQQDTTLQSERTTKNVDFKNNPLKLIPKQSPAQKIQAKPTSFPVVSLITVKLVYISPMPLPEVLRIENVSLLETRQELQPFKPAVKGILSCGIPECTQTTSRGNEGKYSLHVSSKTGAPHVSLNLSLSKASGPDLPCAYTTTRKRMMLASTASKIQQPRALEELRPLKQGPGTILLLIQSSAARWKSLSVSVLTLPPSPKPAEDYSNCLLISMPVQSFLVSALLPLQQLTRLELLPIMESSQLPLVGAQPQSSSSSFSAVFSTLSPEDPSIRLLITALLQPSLASTPLSLTKLRKIFPSEMLSASMESTYRITQEPLELVPFVSVPAEPSPPPAVLEPLPLGEILPPAPFRVPRKTFQLSIVTARPQPRPQPSQLGEILPPPAQAQGHQSLCSADEDNLAILNHSEVECEQDLLLSRKGDGHELLDLSHSEKVETSEFDEPLGRSDIQNTSAFKSGCSESNIPGSKKKRSICRRILALFTCCFRKQRQRKSCIT